MRGDVAVDHVEGFAVGVFFFVGVKESATHADADDDRKFWRDRHIEGASDLDDTGKVDAVDVFHRDKINAVDFAEFVDLDDVGVEQSPRDTGFIFEHLDKVGVAREFGEDALDCDDVLGTIGLFESGSKHFGHATEGNATKQDKFPEAFLSFFELFQDGLSGANSRGEIGGRFGRFEVLGGLRIAAVLFLCACEQMGWERDIGDRGFGWCGGAGRAVERESCGGWHRCGKGG